MIPITKHIRSALDKNIFTCGVFLDFQKFDTVNNGILLSKLSYYVKLLSKVIMRHTS